jgi:hypothetical protein
VSGWDGAGRRTRRRWRRRLRRACELDPGQAGLELAIALRALLGPSFAGCCASVLSCVPRHGWRTLPPLRMDLVGLLGHGSPGVSGGGVREKSLPARPTPMRRHLRVSPFLLGWHRGSLVPRNPEYQEKP